MLQKREPLGDLSAAEENELEVLRAELEADEWQRLRPALRQYYQEQQALRERVGRVRTENALLGALAEREEELLTRARVFLDEVRNEQSMLHQEYERVTRTASVSSS